MPYTQFTAPKYIESIVTSRPHPVTYTVYVNITSLISLVGSATGPHLKTYTLYVNYTSLTECMGRGIHGTTLYVDITSLIAWTGAATRPHCMST
jgi:hypothetical protein